MKKYIHLRRYSRRYQIKQKRLCRISSAIYTNNVKLAGKQARKLPGLVFIMTHISYIEYLTNSRLERLHGSMRVG